MRRFMLAAAAFLTLLVLAATVATSSPPKAHAVVGPNIRPILVHFLAGLAKIAHADDEDNEAGGDGPGVGDFPMPPHPGEEGDIWVGPDGGALICERLPAECLGHPIDGSSEGADVPGWLFVPDTVWRPLVAEVRDADLSADWQLAVVANAAMDAWDELANNDPEGPCAFWAREGQQPPDGWAP